MMESAAVILTKNRVLAETGRALGALGAELHARAPVTPPFQVPPKVSRGENHHGLPWTVLDYPRNFGKDTLALRSLFWWGRSFSSALQLSGDAAAAARPFLLRALPQLSARQFYICTGNDPWLHGKDEAVYRPAAEGRGLEADRPFIKVAAWRPVAGWRDAVPWLEENWEILLRAAGLIA